MESEFHSLFYDVFTLQDKNIIDPDLKHIDQRSLPRYFRRHLEKSNLQHCKVPLSSFFFFKYNDKTQKHALNMYSLCDQLFPLYMYKYIQQHGFYLVSFGTKLFFHQHNGKLWLANKPPSNQSKTLEYFSFVDNLFLRLIFFWFCLLHPWKLARSVMGHFIWLQHYQSTRQHLKKKKQ